MQSRYLPGTGVVGKVFSMTWSSGTSCGPSSSGVGGRSTDSSDSSAAWFCVAVMASLREWLVSAQHGRCSPPGQGIWSGVGVGQLPKVEVTPALNIRTEVQIRGAVRKWGLEPQ